MKTKVVKPHATEYPSLFISEGLVVLMVEKGRGTVVHQGEYSAYEVGYASSTWDMSSFNLFKGQLTLEN